MDKRLITLRDGKSIYTEIYNSNNKHTILMLHGGPGEGCDDYRHQAQKLSERFNVVIFDQRGVKRSDRIPEDEQFGLEQLIDDCEDLKNLLNINKWIVLGHSFGGELALLYAQKYPDSVEKIIFECPTFYYPASVRAIYEKMARIAEKADFKELKNEICEFVDNASDIRVLTDNMGRFAVKVMEYDRKVIISKEIEETNSVIGVTDEQWENGYIQRCRLQEEGRICENMVPILKELRCPSLLIMGRYDPVCYAEQKDFYVENVKDGKVVVFENSDHRPHNEEDEKFFEVVVDFVMKP